MCHGPNVYALASQHQCLYDHWGLFQQRLASSAVHLYADDTVPYATGPSLDASFTALQDSLIQL